MPLSNREIYQNAVGTLSSLKTELKRKDTVENAFQEFKDTYLLKTVKQRVPFAKKMYKQHSNANPSLLKFYARTLKESRKNIGDSLSNDSGIVTAVVDFLQEYFGTETITPNHFSQLKKEIQQALTSEKIRVFLGAELLSLPAAQPKEKSVQLVKETKGDKREYTVKQQALAFHFLISEVLEAASHNKADVARLMHLFSATSLPVDKQSKAIVTDGGPYKEYLQACKKGAMYSLTDLEFVKKHFEPFKGQPGFKKLMVKNGKLDQEIKIVVDRENNKSKDQ